MADISNVRYNEIKDISDSLEGLSCKSWSSRLCLGTALTRNVAACIMTRMLY